jgi:hypothetical protein
MDGLPKPDAFCAGLPGVVAPFGNFDPLGFTTDLPVQEIKRSCEARVTHGHVVMVATVGYLVTEPFHPLFNGLITGPANTHLTQPWQALHLLRTRWCSQMPPPPHSIHWSLTWGVLTTII